MPQLPQMLLVGDSVLDGDTWLSDPTNNVTTQMRQAFFPHLEVTNLAVDESS